MFDQTMSAGSFGYREALAQVNAELTARLREAERSCRRQGRKPHRSLLIDHRGLALR